MPPRPREQPAAGTPNHIIQALLTAETSSEALRKLYVVLKQIDGKYSIPYLCRKAGIPSPGYFSDVMHGKRRLHIKYRESITRALALSGAAARYLRLLITIDNEKDPVKAATLRRKLPALGKALTVVQRPIANPTEIFFFALEVFCAFGLYRNAPRRADLVDYFSEHTPEQVDAAIATLQSMGLVTEQDSRLQLLSTQVDFLGEGLSEVEYLKAAFTHGVTSLKQWLGQPDLALFSSINVSVRKADYQAKLVKLREAIEPLRSELETEDADLLVRLNLQVYPIR